MSVTIKSPREKELMREAGLVKLNNGRMGSKDYETLYNKPRISGVELAGDKDFDELGMERMTNTDIFNLIGGQNSNGY